jgi:hypothetical protein
MDAKKARNAGILGVLSLALALGGGLTGSMSAGAQSQTYVGNEKPDPSHPIVASISSDQVVLAITPDATREVRVDASTLVLKDGKFAGVSALEVGDRVQIDPSITLPNGLAGRDGSEEQSAPSAASQAPAQVPAANPDKAGQNAGSTGSGGSSGQVAGGEGTTSPSAPEAPLDPNNKNTTTSPPPSAGGGQTADDGSIIGAPSAANVIWVTSDSDQVLGGVVHWEQNGTAILNIPGVGYSEYAIHTSDATSYQKMTSAGTAPEAATAADMKVGTSVVVLGRDNAPDNAGYFTAKAILILPDGGKLR